MSATIPESMLLSDLLKSTGYDCPQDLQGKTFDQSTSGGGSEVVLEDNKEVSITANGTVEITPSSGKDGMKKVTANVNVPSDAKPEQTKSVTITENGTTTVTPDSGKTLSSVSITANVSGGGSGSATAYAWRNTGNSAVTWFNFDKSPEAAAGFNDSKTLMFSITGTGTQVDSVTVAQTGGTSAIDSLTKVSDSEFTVHIGSASVTFTRDSTKDFTLWS